MSRPQNRYDGRIIAPNGEAVIQGNCEYFMTDVAPSPQKKKLLVIDDDRDLNRLMTQALAASGYQVFQATTGETGLVLFKTELPDLVLLDVGLPGIGGFEVAAEIRKTEPAGRHTIIVIVTAYSQSFFVSTDFKADIDSYLTKPVLVDTVIEHVETLLARS